MQPHMFFAGMARGIIGRARKTKAQSFRAADLCRVETGGWWSSWSAKASGQAPCVRKNGATVAPDLDSILRARMHKIVFATLSANIRRCISPNSCLSAMRGASVRKRRWSRCVA
jgi:hypothetical protein